MIVGECLDWRAPRRPTEHVVLLLWLSCVFEVSERHRQNPRARRLRACQRRKDDGIRRRRLVRGRRRGLARQR